VELSKDPSLRQEAGMLCTIDRSWLRVVCLVIVAAIWPVTTSVRAFEPPTQTGSTQFTVEDLFDVVNLGTVELSNDGRWVAATAGSLRNRIGIDNYRFGDPTYVAPSLSEVWIIDTQSGRKQQISTGKLQVRGLEWSPTGDRLAMLILNGGSFEPVIWERATNKMAPVKIPPGKHVADNSDLLWSPDGSLLLMALRPNEWRNKAAERFRQETKGPIVVHSSKQPFLEWDDLRRMGSQRSLAAYDPRTGQMRELLPETRLSSFDLSEDGSFAVYSEDITKKTDYDVIFGVENQVQVLPTAGGSPRTLIKSTKGINVIWSRDLRSYAYSKEGSVFFAGIDDKEARQIAGKKPDSEKPKNDANKSEAEKDADKKKDEKERFTAVRLSPKGSHLIASNKEGLWLLDTASGQRDLIVKTGDEDKESPRYQVVDWTPEGDAVYLSFSSKTKWDRGLVRYSVKERKLEELARESRILSGFRVSRNGSTIVFTAADGNRPADLYAADSTMKGIRRLTESNPQLNSKRLSKTELVSYLDADGNKTYGVLYYPVDYESGKKYPTVFIIYEQFFDDQFNGTTNVLTSNGYAVMQPSVAFETGFPGEAWAKGVTAAANKLIEMGVADPERLGVHGTSYGGYATNLLITQTNRFKAAINISGKVNMISFYTDSPRLGVRNIHAPEKSQDRIGATLWQQPQKYIQHSAIMFADRIKTPLLLITGDQDHNVPARQAMEMYYALRRLGKEVEWVNYINGGHGMPTTTVDEVKDYHRRLIAWYDDHLKNQKKKDDASKAEISER
jgi:dipeptidyl aminopeptidase/acylaminoacyl peptidase